VKDKEAKGRGNQAKGEKQGASKITEAQVREIRNKYANGGITQQQLALEYGITHTTVHSLIRRKTWFHITDN
jgi:DNA-binding transcriptional regulator LsrR (DeoR family)